MYKDETLCKLVKFEINKVHLDRYIMQCFSINFYFMLIKVYNILNNVHI